MTAPYEGNRMKNSSTSHLKKRQTNQVLIRWMSTQEWTPKCHIIYIFLVSKSPSYLDHQQRWCCWKATQGLLSHSHAFLISWCYSPKGFFPLCPRSLNYSKACFRFTAPHVEMYTGYLMEVCNQPILLFWWSKNFGVPKITTSRSYCDQGKTIICHPHKYGRSEGVRDPVKGVAKSSTWSLIVMSWEKL